MAPTHMTLLRAEQRAQGRPLVVAHRGHFGGNVVQNTLPAFKNALKQGADILEIDLIAARDGEFYCFHDGYEKAMFNFDGDLRQLTSAEIDQLPTYNAVGQVSGYGATRFFDIADSLLEEAFINLDRCWDELELLLPRLTRLKLMQKILIKTPVEDRFLSQIAELAPEIPYMPILKNIQEFRIVESYGLNTQAVELIVPTPDHELLQAEILQEFRETDLLLFANAIDLGEKYNLSAGYTDTGAILEGEEVHWGKLIDLGFMLIQTDWPLLLRQFIDRRYGVDPSPLHRVQKTLTD